MHPVTRPRLCVGCCALCLLLAAVARAADTIETWDVGTGNFELYSAMDGVGDPAPDQTMAGALVLGWGVAHRFSAFLATGMSADGYLTSAESELNLGVFGTPLDTDHVDLDLLLDMRVSGDNQAAVMPAVEVNLDRQPDLSAYGLYARAGAEIVGRETELGQPERHVDLWLTVGTYLTISPDHQLFLQYDASVHDNPGPETPKYEHDTLGLGYNANLNGNLELITEVNTSLAQAGSSASLGFLVGFIATLQGITD